MAHRPGSTVPARQGGAPGAGAGRVEGRFAAPPRHEDTVSRPRLVATLDAAVDRPLTLLSAPAGFGKTWCLADWLASGTCPGTPVFLTLQSGDEFPGRFWTSTGGALEAAGVDVAPLRAGAAGGGANPGPLPAIVRCVLDHPDPVVWVVDCSELALAPPAGAGVRHLLDRCRGRLRLVLLTRSDPPLPLHRYRLVRGMTDLRAADLAFTDAEAAKLLRTARVHLDDETVGVLVRRTGGWPAGLRFAEMSLAGRSDVPSAIADLRGDAGNVGAFLKSEVLDRQTPAARRLLLRTSVVEELCPELVEVLTDAACDEQALRFLAHGNAFIEAGPSPGIYRFQSLFRELLRTQLEVDQPESVADLHRSAAAWYATQGRLVDAVDHAVRAGDWAVAARYVVHGLSVGRYLIGQDSARLQTVLAAMPADVGGAEASVIRAADALLRLDLAACRAALATAHDALGAWSVPGRQPSGGPVGNGTGRRSDDRGRAPDTSCPLSVVVLEAVAASVGPDLAAALDLAVTAEAALQAAHPSRRQERAELAVLVAGCLARVLLERGELGSAVTALDGGRAVARSVHLPDAVCRLDGMAAVIEAVHGNLDRALELVRRDRAPEGDGDLVRCHSALLAEAWVRMERYDVEPAAALLQAAAVAAPTLEAQVLAKVGAVVRARVLCAQGQPALAAAGLRASRVLGGSSRPPSWLDHVLVVAEASTLLRLGHGEEASALLEAEGADRTVEGAVVSREARLASGRTISSLSPQLRTALDKAPLEVQVVGWLTQARHSLAEGNEGRARSHVDRALALAVDAQLRRPFFEASPQVRALLSRGDPRRAAWLRLPVSSSAEGAVVQGERRRVERRRGDPAFPDAAPAPVTGEVVANPLTPKEQEVLVHLAALLTTEEIAAAMFVSVSTVRTHVRGIFRKLGVRRRNDAVRRAWELHLVVRQPAA